MPNFRGWHRPQPDPLEEALDSKEDFLERSRGDFVKIRRNKEPKLPQNPAVWLAANKMTQTEVSLRLGSYLLTNRLVASDVEIALTSYELTRYRKPHFPVAAYLAGRKFKPQDTDDDWRRTWHLKGDHHALHLTDNRDIADVAATLTSGVRLLAWVSRGLLKSARSPAEHKLLRNVIGKAITCESARRDDLLCAVVPRSSGYRQLAARWRAAEGATRARVCILTVDRTGNVDGLPLDK